jgi:hypothetical protein
MKLLQGGRCELGTKLEDYCLNPLHPEGRHKARVFESALGITRANAEILRSAIQHAAATSENAISRGRNGFGEQFNLSFAMATEDAAATVAHCEDCDRWRRLSTADNLLYFVIVNEPIQMHDVVALLEDVQATHFETGKPLHLRRGQVGTVVLTYDGSAYEVEFADLSGRAYALLTVPTGKLMALHQTPIEEAA